MSVYTIASLLEILKKCLKKKEKSENRSITKGNIKNIFVFIQNSAFSLAHNDW
jgi:hypothetical protein